MPNDNMPIIYPCFYEEGTNNLLACASQQNPSQRCPEKYQRVGESVYCKPINKLSTTASSKQVILTTPRTGGNFKPSLGIMLIVLTILVTIAVVNLIKKQDQ